MASNIYLPSTNDCGEERLEEELGAREDEEEERALAAERAARATADATEEATEEAQEQAAAERITSPLPYAKTALKLRVRVLTRHGRSLLHPGETRISVATSVPAQVKLALRAHGGPVKLFMGESAKERKYVLRVPWTCRTRTRGYTFAVTVYREGDNQIGPGDTIVRRRAFTIDTHTMCGKNQTP